jgi:GntR family transcriptional regulator, arabinose operon transcriptional repressor
MRSVMEWYSGMRDWWSFMIARYAQLISHFRERILDGSLPPGARLPTELELAEKHQISRGTVRQAMSVLVNQGLLERVRGRGTFVRPLPPAATRTPRATERRIGLVLAHSSGSQLDLDILIGVEHAAKSRGYQISFAYAEENIEQLDRDIARLRADLVAGLIIFPVSNATYDQSIWRLSADNIPFVLVDRYFPALDSDYVAADNVGGGYRATEHLLILGHTRVGFVCSAESSLLTTSVRDRWQGYRRALQEYGQPYDEALMFEWPAGTNSDPGASDQLLLRNGRPSAIFAVNDAVALELLRAAQRLGLRVPEDLALIGFDDLNFAAHLNPPLTTVAQPRMDVGLRAGHLLINRIEGHAGPAHHIELPTSLIVRESCGARQRVRQQHPAPALAT